MTVDHSKMKIGLVGVGTMGILVATTLVKAGYPLIATDASPLALERAQEVGATLRDNPQAVAKEAKIILLLLPGPPQIEAVVMGKRGLLAGVKPGRVIIDMSTVDPSTTRRMAQHAAAAGVDYLDAPILGRPSAFGKWVLPVGGETQVLERCHPVLEILAHKIIHVGPLGAGNTLKLLNAFMFSAINAMTAEMMAISVKAGLSPKVLFETISASEAATVSGLFKEVGAKIVARDFSPIFPVDLLCKDNDLAVNMARELGAPPILANAVQMMNELARSQGFGAEDSSALIKVYEKLLGIEEKKFQPGTDKPFLKGS